MESKGLHVTFRDFKRRLWTLMGFKGLQGTSRDFKGLQGTSRDFKGSTPLQKTVYDTNLHFFEEQLYICKVVKFYF
jgi:hypothetical protein